MDFSYYVNKVRGNLDLLSAGMAALALGGAVYATVQVRNLNRAYKDIQVGPPGPPGPPGPQGPAGDSLVRFDLSPKEIEKIPLEGGDIDVEVNSVTTVTVTKDEEEWDESWEEDRTSDAPYVLSYSEFHRGETIGPQLNLTYFAGDDILCTSDDNAIIYNADQVVGALPFGRGSRDPDVVFIRNEKLGHDYEVTRVPHSYQTEVLGMEAEEEAERDDLRHSDRVVKFRPR